MSEMTTEARAALYKAERDAARQELVRERHLRKLAESAAAKRDTVRAEDREAAEWVRGHGGMEGAMAMWSERARLWSELTHVALACGADISVAAGTPEEVGSAIASALERRLMPEGMEWPRYEDGDPVGFGGEFMDHQGNVRSVLTIKMWQEGGFTIGTGQGTYDWHSAGERVKRPAVLAADGEHEPDSWEQLKADIYREVETDKGMRFASEFAEAIVRRCKALVGVIE